MASPILNTSSSDLPLIYDLFDRSVIYQEKNGHISWKNYDKTVLERDVNDGNQYKILIEDSIAMVFSVCYTDRVIWREMENNDALYLHRIVVNPDFKGQRLFGKLLDWAKEHAMSKQLRFVRMDTWAENESIIKYYQSFGFRFVEFYTTPDTQDLPVHNRKLALALLELEIE
jgi:ribosomal protein S18 acetylase RimI-like enzyme